MANANVDKGYSKRRGTSVPVLKNGAAVISLTDALIKMNIVDPATAKHVENGLVKLLRKVARTGGRVSIKDKRRVMLMIDIGEYSWGGEPHPKLRARFDKSLQADVRETHTDAIRERWEALDD